MFISNHNGVNLELTGELKAAELENIKRHLSSSLTSNSPLELDLAGLTGADTAGLQLLLSFCLTKKNNSSLKIINIPPQVAKAMSLTGIDKQLKQFLSEE